MKKIIFFSKNLEIGGMEVALVNMINSIADKYKITLVLEEKKGKLLEKINPNVRIEEYKLSSSKIVFFRKIKNYTKRLIWSIKNRYKYDFACNYATYSIIGARLALVASHNNALYVHSDYYNYFSKDIEKIKCFFNELHISNFKHVIFVSNEAMKNIVSVFPKYVDKYTVINNIFDYSRLVNKNVKLQPKNSKKTFLFLGRLEEESKRITRLLEAMIICRNKKRDYELWIVGDGKDKPSYVKFVDDNKLNETVKFYESTLDIQKYLMSADTLVISSEYEGFPVVYCEAIYFHKNIITTIPTSDDFLDIRDYAIIAEKNADSIAKCMDSKYKEYEEFDFDTYNKRIIDKITSIIEE